MATISVYTGRWTDHSYNDILGSRVTMPTKDATILVAFIALFDGLVGNVFWNLLSYGLHQCRARKGTQPRDGLFHQLQVLLRNSNEPFAFAQNATAGGWAWRKRAKRAMLRAIALAALAITISLIFSAAGVASSLIVSTGSVLLTGGNCGLFNPVGKDLATKAIMAIEGASQGVALLHGSIEYAQTCYLNPLVNRTNRAAVNLSPNADCSFFVKSTLDWTTTIGSPCPFSDPTVCSVPESEVIQLDTGYIDSHEDLGINSHPSDRVQFRRVVTCSPMTTEGFASSDFVETGFPDPFSELMTYSYGYSWAQQISRQNITDDQREEIEAWLLANNVTFAYQKAADQAVGTPYFLDAKSVFLGNHYLDESFFTPVPRIAEDPNSPISVFFMANHALFIGQNVTDPWFQATGFSVQIQDGRILPTYYSEIPGSTMGCLEQYQICNPNNGNRLCSNLNTTFADASPFVLNTETTDFTLGEAFYAPLNMNLMQQQIATNLLGILQTTSFPWLVSQGAADVLLANTMTYTAQAPFSPALPDNQWQIEVEHWMAISSAWLQRYILQSVTGPVEASADPYWQLISDPATATLLNNSAVYAAAQQLCSAQKVKSTAYQSFSVLGLAINFILGGILLIAGIIVRYHVPTELLRRANSKDKDSHRHAAWIGDGNLQLQRTAYEQLGTGDWERHDNTVPLTKKGQLFRRPTNLIGNVSGSGVDLAESGTAHSFTAVSEGDNSLEERTSYKRLLGKMSMGTVTVMAKDSEATMRAYEDVTSMEEDEEGMGGFGLREMGASRRGRDGSGTGGGGFV